MSLSPELKSITPPVQHAEGPFWDEENNNLYYVDTFTATAYRWNYESATIASYKLETHDSIGVIIPIRGKMDEFIIGADRHLYEFTWPNNSSDEPCLKELLMVEEHKPTNQFNDGKVDSNGRLWIGTLTRNPDLSVTPNGGSLYMFKSMDNFEEKISPTSISNGLAWSKSPKLFYFIDSTTRKIVRYGFDENTGNIGCKQTVFDLADHPELEGIPDGMTIDSEDNLWIALFGGHSIINVDTKMGTLIRVIRLPVTYVTSACFGGPQFDTLYVTTSKLHLDEGGIAKEPLAGCVFAVTNLGVKGLPSNKIVLS